MDYQVNRYEGRFFFYFPSAESISRSFYGNNPNEKHQARRI